MKTLSKKLNHIMKLVEQYQIEIIAGFLFLFGIYLRLEASYFLSGDYVIFLKPWMEQIVEAGGFASLSQTIGDYTPPYMYLLTLLSYFPSASVQHPFLFGIKFYSLLFDIVLVVGVYLNVKLFNSKKGHLYGLLAALLVFFLPTIVLNSAYWGQIDASYTAFALLGLYYLRKNALLPAFIWYGVALSFKLQAIFFLPVWILYMWLNHRKNVHYFLILPMMYYVLAIPAFLAGRSFLDLTMIYVNQAESYRALTLNMPNLYQWLPNRYDDLSRLGFGVFAAFMGTLFLFLTHQKITLKESDLLPLAFWSVLMANFFLPAMHERYLYAADVLGILLLFNMRRSVFYPVLVQFISLLAYTPFLFGVEIIKHEEVAFIFLGLLLYASFTILNPIMNKKTS